MVMMNPAADLPGSPSVLQSPDSELSDCQVITQKCKPKILASQRFIKCASAVKPLSVFKLAWMFSQ